MRPLPPPSPRLRRLAGAVVLALAAGFYLYRDVWVPWAEMRARPADFDNYYAAARALLAGGTPYERIAFDYPPLVAFLLLPVAGLDYATARAAWFVLAEGALVASAWLLWRLLGGGLAAAVTVAVVWAAGGTVAENLVLGQVSPLLLLLVTLALAALARRPQGSSGASDGAVGGGVAVGAAAALKLWPAVLLGAFALAGKRRGLVAGALALLALVAVPWAVVATRPPPHLPRTADYWMGTPAVHNFSLPAVALRLADPPAAGARLPRDWLRGNNPVELHLPPGRRALSVSVAALTLLAGAAVLWWRVRRRPLAGEEAALAAAALVTLALLASPICWYHYQLLAFPGLALLAWRWRRRAGALVALALVGAGLTWSQVAAVGLYLARYGPTAANPPLLWLATSLVPALGLVLFALLVGELG